MNFPGIVHVQANLLDCIGDVRLGEGEKLKSTCKAAISCGIINRRAGINSNFSTIVDRIPSVLHANCCGGDHLLRNQTLA